MATTRSGRWAPTDAPGEPARTPTSRTGTPSDGFTLLELLVTLAILGLVAAALALAFPNAGSRGSGDHAGRIRQVLADASAAARRSGVPVVVEVDGAGQARSLRTIGGRGETSLADVGAPMEILAGAEGGSGRGRVYVFPDGSTSGGVLRVERGGRAVDLRIGRLAGRVTVDRQ